MIWKSIFHEYLVYQKEKLYLQERKSETNHDSLNDDIWNSFLLKVNIYLSPPFYENFKKNSPYKSSKFHAKLKAAKMINQSSMPSNVDWFLYKIDACVLTTKIIQNFMLCLYTFSKTNCYCIRVWLSAIFLYDSTISTFVPI